MEESNSVTWKLEQNLGPSILDLYSASTLELGAAHPGDEMPL